MTVVGTLASSETVISSGSITISPKGIISVVGSPNLTVLNWTTKGKNSSLDAI